MLDFLKVKKPFIIGVSSFARGGKNTFCTLLQNELLEKYKISSYQLSFALQLRKDLELFVKLLGYNVWEDKDKKIIRPLMVWYANSKRKTTGGQYFINALKRQIKELEEKYNIFLINDLRFAQEKYDEIDYVKENGVVVHISKYNVKSAPMEIGGPYIKVFNKPPNEFEAKNDPLIKEKSDYLVEWEDVEGDINKLKPHVSEFVGWLYGKEYI